MNSSEKILDQLLDHAMAGRCKHSELTFTFSQGELTIKLPCPNSFFITRNGASNSLVEFHKDDPQNQEKYETMTALIAEFVPDPTLVKLITAD